VLCLNFLSRLLTSCVGLKVLAWHALFLQAPTFAPSSQRGLVTNCSARVVLASDGYLHLAGISNEPAYGMKPLNSSPQHICITCV
jgi:hypothetical protein